MRNTRPLDKTLHVTADAARRASCLRLTYGGADERAMEAAVVRPHFWSSLPEPGTLSSMLLVRHPYGPALAASGTTPA